MQSCRAGRSAGLWVVRAAWQLHGPPIPRLPPCHRSTQLRFQAHNRPQCVCTCLTECGQLALAQEQGQAASPPGPADWRRAVRQTTDAAAALLPAPPVPNMHINRPLQVTPGRLMRVQQVRGVTTREAPHMCGHERPGPPTQPLGLVAGGDKAVQSTYSIRMAAGSQPGGCSIQQAAGQHSGDAGACHPCSIAPQPLVRKPQQHAPVSSSDCGHLEVLGCNGRVVMRKGRHRQGMQNTAGMHVCSSELRSTDQFQNIIGRVAQGSHAGRC